jgi:hypothetical protein
MTTPYMMIAGDRHVSPPGSLWPQLPPYHILISGNASQLTAVSEGDLVVPKAAATDQSLSLVSVGIVVGKFTETLPTGYGGTHVLIKLVPAEFMWSTAALHLGAAGVPDSAYYQNFLGSRVEALLDGWVGGGTGVECMIVEPDGSTTTDFAAPMIRHWMGSKLWADANQENVDVTGDASDPVVWDAGARRATKITVDGSTTLYPGDIIRNAGNTWSGVVLYSVSTAGDDELYVHTLTGTPSVSDTITRVWWNCTPLALGGVAGAHNTAVTNRSVVSVETHTKGAWAPYAPLPGLGLTDPQEITYGTTYGQWAVPPSDGMRLLTAPSPTMRMIPSFKNWCTGMGFDDCRVVKYSSLEDGAAAGVRGGVAVQEIDVSAVAGDFVAGETVSNGGAWSAQVICLSDAEDVMFVRQTNGGVLTATDTITGASSGATATADSTVFGWRKGSLHYENMRARFIAARDDAAGQPGGAAQVRKVALFPWSGEWNTLRGLDACVTAAGDVAAWTNGAAPFTYGVAYKAIFGPGAQDYADLIAELLTDSDFNLATDADITILSHRSDAQGYQPSLTFGAFTAAEAIKRIRENWRSAAQTASNHSHVRSPNYQMMADVPMTSGALGAFVDNHEWLRNEDYLNLGIASWRKMSGLDVSYPETFYEYLPIVIYLGQSQVDGLIDPSKWLPQDADPSLYHSSEHWPLAGVTVDTTTDSVMHWNFADQQIQKYDIGGDGANTAWFNNGWFGAEAPLMARARERFGKVLLFKIGIDASSVSADTNGYATWSPTASQSSVTRGDLTFTAVGSTIEITSAGGAVFGNLLGTSGGRIGQQDENGATLPLIPLQLASDDANYNDDQPVFVYAVTASCTSSKLVIQAGIRTSLYPAGTPGSSVTVKVGPPPCWVYVKQNWSACLDNLVNVGDGDGGLAQNKRYIPKVYAVIFENGEADLVRSGDYAQNYANLWEAIDAVFLTDGLVGGATPIRGVVQLHAGTPFGTDTQVANIREAQRAQAEAMPGGILIDPSNLALELSVANVAFGNMPYLQFREYNGLHLTPRNMVNKGFLLDAALASASTWPPHPTGAAEVIYGATTAGTFDSVLAGGDDGEGELDGPAEGEDGPGSPGGDGLIVEDGSGFDNADSYASVATADGILEEIGTPASWTAAATAVKAQALRRATREWMEGLLYGLWRGVIKDQTQRLSWPRIGAFDDEGRVVAPGTIPWQIVHAVSIVAADIVDGGTILPTGYQRGAVLRETKKAVGFEKTVEYSGIGASGDSAVQRRRRAEALVYPFVDGDEGGVTI